MAALHPSRPLPRIWLTECLVYLLCCHGRYKIGRSKDPERRRLQCQSYCPFWVSLAWKIRTNHADRLERHWHKRFADRRTHGEWFALWPEDVVEVCSATTSLVLRGKRGGRVIVSAAPGRPGVIRAGGRRVGFASSTIEEAQADLLPGQRLAPGQWAAGRRASYLLFEENFS